jgi:hypothetical protein
VIWLLRHLKPDFRTIADFRRVNRSALLLDELDKTGEDQISLTDPDARAMARRTKVGVAYNIKRAITLVGIPGLIQAIRA